MPDESATPVGTTQTSQNNQAVTNQSGNDFILDFGDLGDDTQVAEEVEVDSLSHEDEKPGDELGFDIDLQSDDQSANIDTEEGVVLTENEHKSENNLSTGMEESDDNVGDFDLSMDYDGSVNELPSEKEEVVADEEELPSEKEEVVADEEELPSEKEEIVADEEELPPEESSISENDANISEEVEDQPNEGHLFDPISEDKQNEVSFEQYNTNSSENLVDYESDIDIPLSTGEIVNDEIATDTPIEGSGELTSVLSNQLIEGVATLGESIEEKQPEIGDLLSNAPVTLPKEMDDINEISKHNLGDTENPANLDESLNGINSPENINEQDFGEITPEQNISREGSVLLSDESQTRTEETSGPQIIQTETAENIPQEMQDLPQEKQTDERSEIVNNSVSNMDDINTVTPEVNISTPVELSSTSSNQQEIHHSGSENQVKSTLSLDQILDSELLFNPQYSDNSKASPQNITENKGSKSKVGLFVGVGVAMLACCVAVLAFPSITIERKPEDTVNTGTTIEYSEGTEEQHPSAPDKPTGLETSTEDTEKGPDLSVTPVIGGEGSAQIVSFPDGEDEPEVGGNTQPVPYIGYDEGNDNPDIQEIETEKLDAKQIADVILSFKTQGEGYYSFAQSSSDNQLMKYSLRLINLCDNYTDKVNNGEGVDSESFSSFKSSANKIISKIDTYLGGDEDVPVIREATIDGETNFEGKDEIKEYLYNNR